MGLILDSSVTIAAERRCLPVEDMLAAIREQTGPEEVALSAVSVMELEHGIWRAKEPVQAVRRKQFLEDLIANIPVYPSRPSWRVERAASMPSSRPEESASRSRTC
jgi:tRNA(fMet)-specific endonuclease VapC